MHIGSNHKRLVNACYPTEDSKTETSSKPNSNSLSKLTYYCQTKPHKIKKVTNYLISYAQSQSKPASITSTLSPYRHSKSGLLCTLQIFNSILISSHHHLEEFLIDLLYLIHIGLGLIPTTTTTNNSNQPSKGIIGDGWVGEDLELAIQSIELFSNWVQFIESKTFLDDSLFKSHLFLLAKFSSISLVNFSSKSSNFARSLAVLALGDIVLSDGLYCSTEFSGQVKLTIPGIMASFLPNQADKSNDSVLKIIKELGDESRRMASTEELEINIQIMRQKIQETLKKPNPTPVNAIDLTIYSLHIFQFLLSTDSSSLIQFEIIISLIFSNLESSLTILSNDFLEWYLSISKRILSWSRIKYRSIVIDLLVSRLTILDTRLSQKDSKKELLKGKMKIFGMILKSLLEDEMIQTIEVLNVMKIFNELIKLLFRNPQVEILIDCMGSICLNPFDTQQIDEVCQLVLERVISDADSTNQEFTQSLLKALNLILLKTNRLPSYQIWIPFLLSDSPNLKTTNLFDKALTTYLKRFDFSSKTNEDHKAFLSAINVFVYRTDQHQSILEILSKKKLSIYLVCLPMLMQLDFNTTLILKTFELVGWTDEVKEWDSLIQKVLNDFSGGMQDEEEGMNEERFKDEVYKRIWTVDYGLRIAGIEMINKRKSQKPISIKRISSIKSYNTSKSMTPSKQLYLKTKYSNYPSIVELRESLLLKNQQHLNQSVGSCESFGDGGKSSIASKKSLRVERSSRVLEAIEGLECRAASRLGFGEGSGRNGNTNGDSSHSIRLHMSPPYGP